MPGPHQLHVKREEVRVTARDLLAVPEGEITAAGLRTNVDVGIQYLESWLRDLGCVPIYNLMEDAATAEISRTQVWQWTRHGVKLADGRAVTAALVEETIAAELEKLGGGGRFPLAAELFRRISTGRECPEFLTQVAYEYLD